jgi:hypothetical protein
MLFVTLSLHFLWIHGYLEIMLPRGTSSLDPKQLHIYPNTPNDEFSPQKFDATLCCVFGIPV